MKIRKQSGCVVYRKVDGEIQILLVQKKESVSWGFPKGGIQDHMDEKESAAKETFEEAGVQGKVGKRLGDYIYKKNGKNQVVFMYPMLVTKEFEQWPEMSWRQRRWFNLQDAKKHIPKKLHRFFEKLDDKTFMEKVIEFFASSFKAS